MIKESKAIDITYKIKMKLKYHQICWVRIGILIYVIFLPYSGQFVTSQLYMVEEIEAPIKKQPNKPKSLATVSYAPRSIRSHAVVRDSEQSVALPECQFEVRAGEIKCILHYGIFLRHSHSREMVS